MAEHSLLVSEVAIGFEFEALLHDAAEAFTATSRDRLNKMLPEYKRIEREVETAIFTRFGIPSPLPIEVKAPTCAC